jgi:hypothetical protein
VKSEMAKLEKVWNEAADTISFHQFPPPHYEIIYEFKTRLLRKSMGEKITAGEYKGGYAARWLEHTLSEKEDSAIRTFLKNLQLAKKTDSPDLPTDGFTYFTLEIPGEEGLVLATSAAETYFSMLPSEVEELRRLIDLIPNSRWTSD